MFRPKHLSLFALERTDSSPAAMLPFYAEVVAPVEQPLAPVEFDPRFEDSVDLVLRGLEAACHADPACRRRLKDAVQDALARVLAQEARDAVTAEADGGRRAVDEIVKRTQQAMGHALGDVRSTRLRDGLVAAVTAYALAHGLRTNPPDVPRVTTPSAYPLGVLATDHVGYLSFDLTRLPADVFDAVVDAAEARRNDAAAEPKTSVWLYALGREDLRFDALAQGRIGEDAIVVKLQFDAPPLPAVMREAGILSLQSPSLTDWRLSPASFAANPSALVGADGCEALLPANLATQAYSLYQVVGLTNAQVPLPAALQDRVRLGVVHDYAIKWYPLGHSLGQIVYSVPLAPGESVNLAVVDWTRRDDTQRKEHTTLDEQLVHDEHRDRMVSETVNASIKEYQHGSSFMGGVAGSGGLSAAVSGIGVAAGLTGSLGGSTASSDGSRRLAANTVQRISDNISQASAAQRELNSTVVVHSSQAEHEAIETRTVVNYNHSHALTILYYEVLRHFRVDTAFDGDRAAVLIKVRMDWFADAGAGDNVRLNRGALQAALIDPQLAGAFDAIERNAHRVALRPAPPPDPPPPSPPPPSRRDLVYFTFEVRTGGLSPDLADVGDSQDDRVDIRAGFLGAAGYTKLVNRGASDGDLLTYPTALVGNDQTCTFVAGVAPPAYRVKRSDIDALSINIAPVNCNVGIQFIKVIARDVTGGDEVILDHEYRADGGDLVMRSGATLILPLNPSPPDPQPPAPPPEVLEDEAAERQLLAHLQANADYYSRAVALGQSPSERAAYLATIAFPDGTSALDHVENRPLELVGDFMAYPCTDVQWSHAVEHLLAGQAAPAGLREERLVTLPTRGVFAEAKLGQCNASEPIDNTRFWDWQQSPIPHLAPDIAAAQPVTPAPHAPDLGPTPFPQSLVNIVNPPAAPDPSGLAAALSTLATPNIFRDMSGQTAVADLLKRLSDNTIGIAEAANRARDIQARYGSNVGAAGSGASGAGGLGGAGSVTPLLGGPRAGPTQPSALNRDLGDRRQELLRGMADGLLTPEAAQAAYGAAARGLENVDERYSQLPTGVTIQQLIGLVGEQNLIEALADDGLIVLYDWTKTVATPGVDVIAIKRTIVGDKVISELWLIDNKAQLKGIAGAPALTGPQFTGNLQAVRDFLVKQFPNKALAAEAVTAIDTKSFRKVVGNAWAGSNTTFTQSLLANPDVHVYDVRLAKGSRLFSAYADWRTAFKALPKGARRIGMRGAALFDSSLLVLAVAAGALWIARDPDEARQVVGELAANALLDGLLSFVPGGWAAAIALTLETDNPQALKEQRRNETIDKICGSMPEFGTRPQPEQDAIRKTIGSMLDDPLVVTIPQPQKVYRQVLPGVWTGPDGEHFFGSPPSEA